MKLSASKISVYKSCKRKYELNYVEELVPVEKTQALEIGSNYHSYVEDLHKQGYFLDDFKNAKVSAMAFAYEKYIYPNFQMLPKDTEKSFEVQLNERHTLVGRFDGVAIDGLPVEHKTTSSNVEEFVYWLDWNEQVLCYMLALGVNEMYYTICKKPTIKPKQKESEEDFFNRCCDWYKEDTDNKIRFVKISRTQQQINEFKKELIELADEMENCKVFHKNTQACKSYGVACPYASICLCYDKDKEYVEFTKKEI